MATEEGPRHAVITPDDHGAILSMTAWFLACTLVLCTATRLIVRFTTQQMPSTDDVYIVVAAVFAIGGTIAMSLAVNSGLGKRAHAITGDNISSIHKDVYAATILYVLTVGLSKFSMCAFLTRLAATKLHKMAIAVLGIVVLCWTIAITIGVVFECALPRPWEVFTGKCIDPLAFWTPATVVDVCTDVAMIIIPIHIVWGLQMQGQRKAVVVFIFLVRVVLIIASLARLLYLRHFVRSGMDASFDSIPYGLATQVHSTLSIIVACSSALKPFMDSVRTGMLSVSLAKHGAGTTFGQDSYNLRTLSNSGNDSSHASSQQQNRPVSEHYEQIYENQREASRSRSRSRTRNNTRKHVLLQDSYGRIIKRPLADIESRASFSSGDSISPPRPTSPPTELRPDLTMFRARIISESGSRGHLRGVDAGNDSLRPRGSGDGAESQKGLIQTTKTWDVRFDDNYHAT
ncbi:hypothetical protein K491DRAFT_709782 [Lophiostoma macrostomum CBS 122681]|uniref:Rhodopsin domain-containing protein n=1 Tax=Lophiostoma macrostomum CBS 122681 TaxID=1314788 RepID=A0A6A6TTY2_9PLEO|nr:hypothetical protein K491DRAFT_709782 [Lophiostoma macrostomum CBS 122681]